MSGVCHKKGNAIFPDAQSLLDPVSTSTTKNRCMAQHYTTIFFEIRTFKPNYTLNLSIFTTNKRYTESNYTINEVNNMEM